jgi:hypothetical protein
MADIVHDPRLADWELRAHRQTFRSFNKLVLFAILHVGLVLGCLALATRRCWQRCWASAAPLP